MDKCTIDKLLKMKADAQDEINRLNMIVPMPAPPSGRRCLIAPCDCCEGIEKNNIHIMMNAVIGVKDG